MEGVREVCSSCACWIEEGWIHCIECGAARPLRPSRNLFATSRMTAITSVYQSHGNNKLEPLAKERRTKQSSLMWPRQASNDVVRRHLHQWRRKSKAQEALVKDLEESNSAIHRIVATKSLSDLQHAVREGRAVVRNWPSAGSVREAFSPATTAVVPPELRKQGGAATLVAFANQTTANRRDFSTGHTSRKSSSVPGSATTVLDGDGGALRREHRRDDYYSPNAPHVHVLSSCSVVRMAAPTGRSSSVHMKRLGTSTLRGRAEENLPVGGSRSISIHATEPQELRSGWFWGTGEYCKGDADNNKAKPGEGAMGSFWRGIDTANHTFVFSDVSSQAGNRPDSSRKELQDCTVRDPRDGSSDSSKMGGSIIFSGSKEIQERSQPSDTSTSTSNSAFMAVASATTAVRSASNRAAELSHLLSEGINATREECLAKVESTVRAAQSAISCANDLLFEMELQVGATVAGRQRNQDSDAVDPHACFGSDKHDIQISDHRGGNESLLTSHIAQLTEQLKLAQTLQAKSLAAKAGIIRRYARHDAAATLLQAHMRGLVARSKTKSLKEASLSTKQKKQALQQDNAESPTTLSEDADNNSVVYFSVPPDPPPNDKENEGIGGEHSFSSVVAERLPPREAQGWWTLAEEENAEDTGEPELALLKAVVKLQSIVRSHLARSKTIAAVNARFVEYFDEEYQHPFYVCAETNTSQWNRPFGFGVGVSPVSTSYPTYVVEPSVDVDFRHDHVNGAVVVVERSSEEEKEEDDSYRAAVVIQCALRAARARRHFAEKIISVSL